MEKVFLELDFDWDTHNIDKIWKKHKVRFPEAEEVFFDINLTILPDPTHSIAEERYIALGKTKTGRPLFVVFTERAGKIRIILARDMNKKERSGHYEQTKESAVA
ncbi:MAG: BrnT family toxin [Elusimicrobiota bacterium]